MRQPPSSFEPVRRHLLAMLAATPAAGLRTEAALDPGQWALLQRMARQHRLEPLLYESIRRNARTRPVPAEIAADWAAAFHQSAMRSLAIQATLSRIGGLFAAADIAYAALKGARLAWHSYRHPALRPMRDLDLLVSPSRAREAYEMLAAKGFTPSTVNLTPVDIALQGAKHLPGLFDPDTGICVELHLRLFEHMGAGNAAAQFADADRLLAGREWLKLGSQDFAFLPPTETLLHLIVHGACDHRFDNGPQLLHDIAALLASAHIDWDRFWDLAEEGGWRPSCELLLRLTEDFLGPQPIAWGCERPPVIPAAILDYAALLMLQDTAMRQDLAMQLQIGTVSSGPKFGRLLGKVLPPRHVIAAYAGVPANRPGVWRHYPSWLLSRTMRTLRGAVSQGQREEVARALAVEGWLARVSPPRAASPPPSRRP